MSKKTKGDTAPPTVEIEDTVKQAVGAALAEYRGALAKVEARHGDNLVKRDQAEAGLKAREAELAEAKAEKQRYIDRGDDGPESKAATARVDEKRAMVRQNQDKVRAAYAAAGESNRELLAIQTAPPPTVSLEEVRQAEVKADGTGSEIERVKGLIGDQMAPEDDFARASDRKSKADSAIEDFIAAEMLGHTPDASIENLRAEQAAAEKDVAATQGAAKQAAGVRKRLEVGLADLVARHRTELEDLKSIRAAFVAYHREAVCDDVNVACDALKLAMAKFYAANELGRGLGLESRLGAHWGGTRVPLLTGVHWGTMGGEWLLYPEVIEKAASAPLKELQAAIYAE